MGEEKTVGQKPNEKKNRAGTKQAPHQRPDLRNSDSGRGSGPARLPPCSPRPALALSAGHHQEGHRRRVRSAVRPKGASSALRALRPSGLRALMSWPIVHEAGRPRCGSRRRPSWVLGIPWPRWGPTTHFTPGTTGTETTQFQVHRCREDAQTDAICGDTPPGPELSPAPTCGTGPPRTAG